MSRADRQARRAIVGALLCQMGLGLGGYFFAVFLRPITVINATRANHQRRMIVTGLDCR